MPTQKQLENARRLLKKAAAGEGLTSARNIRLRELTKMEPMGVSPGVTQKAGEQSPVMQPGETPTLPGFQPSTPTGTEPASGARDTLIDCARGYKADYSTNPPRCVPISGYEGSPSVATPDQPLIESGVTPEPTVEPMDTRSRLMDITTRRALGETLSEDDVRFLVEQEFATQDTAAEQAQLAADREAQLFEQTIAERQAQLEATTAQRSKEREALVGETEALLGRQAQAETESLQAAADRERAIAQGIMAFQGFGVSTAAIQAQQDIQARYNAQISLVQQAKDLQVQQLQAELQNADQAELDAMQAQIDDLQIAAATANYDNVLEIAELNESNNVSAAEALENIASILPANQAAEVSVDVSQLVGYVADQFGNPVITDANGNPVEIRIDTAAAKDTDYLKQLYAMGASEEIIGAFKSRAGITDENDPMFQAELRIRTAEAQIAEIEASGEPIYNSTDWWNREALKIEVGMAEAELNEIQGTTELEPADIDVDNWDWASSGSNTMLSYSRMYPGSSANKEGPDFAASVGTAVSSNVSGQVISVTNICVAGDKQCNGGWGNQVKIQDSNGNLHTFNHLSQVNIAVGQSVRAGALIGEVGNTGNVLGGSGETLSKAQIDSGRGSHLDYTVYKPDGSKYTLGESMNFAFGTPRSTQDGGETAGDRVISIMRNSKGGARVNQSSLDQLGKSFGVVDQLETLTYKLGLDEIEGTDADGNAIGIDLSPISGWFAEKNPWDKDAQEVKAILTGTVPNVARGIFGEVGVLTDTDIALYTGTLPNLKQTDDVKKLVTAALLKTVGNGVRDQLELLGGTGYDVSQLVPKYQDLINAVATMESDLGISTEEVSYSVDPSFMTAEDHLNTYNY